MHLKTFIIHYKNLFDNVRNKDHKLHHLLPPENTPYYSLRRHRPFDCPAARTNRFKNSLIHNFYVYELVTLFIRYNSYNNVYIMCTSVLCVCVYMCVLM